MILALLILTSIIMPDDYKIKKIDLMSDGESILSLLSDKTDRLRFTVSNGLTLFRDGKKNALKMSTVADISKSTITVYPDNVTQETTHHYAIINPYIFIFGLDTTTGFPAVYRSNNGTSWTKIKDFGTPYDESGSMWARGNTLFVTFGSGAGAKYSYSTDFGATWTAAAAWNYAYPYNHWNFPDGMYFDVGTKIMRTSDGFTMEDFWNYSTVEPWDLEYFNSFIYAFGTRTGEIQTLSFGRLENGRYNEIERFTGADYPAMSRVDDYIILTFIKKGKLEIYAYDLESLYHIAEIADQSYNAVRVAGHNAEGSLFIVAGNQASSYDKRHQFQITNKLAIYKNRVWASNYQVEDIIIFNNKEYWVVSDFTAHRVYLCLENPGIINSLTASIYIYTDYLEIGEHIPIGLRVHHAGGIAESGTRQNIIITPYLDMWGDSLSIDLGTCNCANENIALMGRVLDGSEAFSSFDGASAQMATNYRFPKDKLNRGDRVYFQIQLLADTEEFLTSPILYGIDYLYKPVDFNLD